MFPEKKVWIAGNFDIPVSEILAQIIETKQTNKEHIMVVECSSFMLYQLQDFSFDYSILLNIARDHLDWHKDWDEYRDSKLNLLKFTKKCGICPLELMEHLSHETRNHTKKLPLEYDLSETQFLGKHNQSNLAAVRLLTENYVVDSHLDLAMYQEKFTEVVKTVSPLDHRLKLLTEK
ncbi:TPA: hypothetical protein DEP21_00055 [Patescibacteria group bacterium]|nr:hypothetical protein [Candidatus Gracilibacteria bacterium]